MSLMVMGIHTGVGKTLCSAVLCQVLGYDYWKPVQAGNLEDTDSDFVRTRVKNPMCTVHGEAFRFSLPASPHYAAVYDGVQVSSADILDRVPATKRPLVVETSGGVLTPLTASFTCADLAVCMAMPVVLVVRDYLGCINHTMLSVEFLRQRNVEVAGLVFSGKEDAPAREYILGNTQLPLLFTIPQMRRKEAEDIQRVGRAIVLPSFS